MAWNLHAATAATALTAGLLFSTGCSTGKSREGTPLPDRQIYHPPPLTSSPEREPIIPAALPLSPEPEMGATPWISVDGWGRSHGLGPAELLSSHTPETCAIGTVERMLTLATGSRRAQCNGIACWLGFPPHLINGVMHVHHLDAQKNLLPLLVARFWRPPQGGTIVLDPGHGGRDPGTRSVAKLAWEKDYTLDWALRLRPLLQAQGWKVVLTRETDVDVSLADRVRMADEQSADLFVSLHFNSADANRALAGIETYCLTPLGMPSTLQRFDEDDTTRAWPNNGFDAQNLQIAQRVHSALVETTHGEDRGVRRARFMAVLREQQRPAILIEGGYLSNPDEASRIDRDAFRQGLAAVVARALR